MKKIILATAIAAAFAANFSFAQEPPKPDNEISFNAALTSDYRYRGISQSRLQPALSGGADFVNNPSGFYAGTWLSTIKWISDTNNGDSKVELDLYAGKRGEVADGVAYDVGVLSYVYPSNGLSVSANTTELYGQVGFGPAYLKYSHSVTNLFGFENSKNSGYVDLGANVDIAEGTVLNLHIGKQTVKNNGAYSYTDWKVGVTKDFGIVSGSIAAVGTNTDAYVGPSAKNLGKTSLVVAVSKTF
jgi:uncharacterized protein (TIGR02001 family)